jgi:hypothetical protein
LPTVLSVTVCFIRITVIAVPLFSIEVDSWVVCVTTERERERGRKRKKSKRTRHVCFFLSLIEQMRRINKERWKLWMSVSVCKREKERERGEEEGKRLVVLVALSSPSLTHSSHSLEEKIREENRREETRAIPRDLERLRERQRDYRGRERGFPDLRRERTAAAGESSAAVSAAVDDAPFPIVKRTTHEKKKTEEKDGTEGN